MASTRTAHAIITAALLLSCSCRHVASASSPEGVVAAYFAAVDQGDDKAAFALLCDADRSTVASRPSPSEHGGGSVHVVKKVLVDGDHASATVSVTGPDPRALLAALASVAKDGHEPTVDDIRKVSQTLPKSTREHEVGLVREGGTVSVCPCRDAASSTSAARASPATEPRASATVMAPHTTRRTEEPGISPMISRTIVAPGSGPAGAREAERGDERGAAWRGREPGRARATLGSTLKRATGGFGRSISRGVEQDPGRATRDRR
jgi:hypothetical protein